MQKYEFNDLTEKAKLNTIKLFDTPLIHIEVLKEELVIINRAYSWAFDLAKSTESVIKSNRGGFQSKVSNDMDTLPPDLFHLFEKKLSSLPLCNLMGWWLNVNKKGDFNIVHTHPLADASVVFYLTDNQGSLVFQHPSAHSRWAFINAFGEKHATRIFANAGDMLIFPADLEHYVEPNELEEVRISISMNLKF